MDPNQNLQEEPRKAPQEITREQMLKDADTLLTQFALDYERMAQ